VLPGKQATAVAALPTSQPAFVVGGLLGRESKSAMGQFAIAGATAGALRGRLRIEKDLHRMQPEKRIVLKS
jgi:hypothetical protein